MPTDLLSLPFSLQLMLGSGYLAYLVAYSGIRDHHTTTDTIFRTLAFGLITTVSIKYIPIVEPYLSIIAFALTVLTGGFWRWQGMHWAQSVLSASRVSWSDDLPTAWLSVTAKRTDFSPSQIAVDLDNGRVLFCEDTRLFASAPFGPCIFGLDGSVALYVTAEMGPDGNWVEHEDIFHDEEGARITIVPASSISRVEIRQWQDTNAKAVKEAEKASPEVDSALEEVL